jgi:hypothetical protein
MQTTQPPPVVPAAAVLVTAWPLAVPVFVAPPELVPVLEAAAAVFVLDIPPLVPVLEASIPVPEPVVSPPVPVTPPVLVSPPLAVAAPVDVSPPDAVADAPFVLDAAPLVLAPLLDARAVVDPFELPELPSPAVVPPLVPSPLLQDCRMRPPPSTNSR